MLIFVESRLTESRESRKEYRSNLCGFSYLRDISKVNRGRLLGPFGEALDARTGRNFVFPESKTVCHRFAAYMDF